MAQLRRIRLVISLLNFDFLPQNLIWEMAVIDFANILMMVKKYV